MVEVHLRSAEIGSCYRRRRPQRIPTINREVATVENDVRNGLTDVSLPPDAAFTRDWAFTVLPS